MSAPPKVGDVLLVATVLSDWRDRSKDHTAHVWVQATGYTAGLALNEEGTSWVRAGDDEGLTAMIAARALAGLPPVEPSVA